MRLTGGPSAPIAVHLLAILLILLRPTSVKAGDAQESISPVIEGAWTYFEVDKWREVNTVLERPDGKRLLERPNLKTELGNYRAALLLKVWVLLKQEKPQDARVAWETFKKLSAPSTDEERQSDKTISQYLSAPHPGPGLAGLLETISQYAQHLLRRPRNLPRDVEFGLASLLYDALKDLSTGHFSPTLPSRFQPIGTQPNIPIPPIVVPPPPCPVPVCCGR